VNAAAPTACLSAAVAGVGLVGPGLSGWPDAREKLRGTAAYEARPTALPEATALPPPERRRAGTVIKLALAVGAEAAADAGIDPATLPSVFSSSGGDGDNCHAICAALASADRQLSPTRFHNSVHNAAAGYWSIAHRATAAFNALCGFDASFAAGLLEALVQVATLRTPVLLVAYDTSYPEPLRSKRPIPDAFGVAMVLAPADAVAPAHVHAYARLRADLSVAPAERMSDAGLEALRTAIPAARSLPLLQRLAARQSGCCTLDYLDTARLAVEVSF
jgi:hypothetical protein